MSRQEKGGFRPPPTEKLIWKCSQCETFNSTKEPACKKCGAEKPKK
ncbi:hypothetical protein DesLBE_0875 [Desulfitobacterium sp. LBE]|uniref:RanBP2-type domain-containing protein n=4 Tax=root TaxID=1 RepID=A0A1M7UJR4_9FIRM|nr:MULTISPECIES: hypothetical protein [Desulfitobacterium]ACL20541.1 hypothetical protein Dhaf_2513 [Desulfitobacterium hafniense DCB-2]EHL04406.1 hypothetical protein HMPREF0322_04916 [Desulfitobacterium hafniense DP7]MEA5025576.1 hypothetical protein [Desulfitobacterium hafniense]TWH56631.1 hypothetical protein DesLBE_0875 [Desulfitobacterium sp. LBE]SHN83160.1 hypothetical protein SAMN02745215_03967 [Desulfitobacterium chlororespirans DSM 11544]